MALAGADGGTILKTVPYEHQQRVLARSYKKRDWALFLEMGTGKSKIALDTAALLFYERSIDSLLIVAPKGTYKNWAEIEIPRHMADWVQPYVAVWTPQPNRKEAATLEQVMRSQPHRLPILVMNVEAFATKKGVATAERFLKGRKALFVVDESTTIKNPKALRTKAIVKLGKLAAYRRILTGSPVTKSPLDLYAQCAFLDTRHLGHASYFTFRNRYAIVRPRKLGQRQFNEVVGFQRLDELNEILDRFSSRILKKDCLDLPPKIYQQRHVELSKEQERAYNEMKALALATLNGMPVVTAASAISQLLRLHQIVCGHLPHDDGSVSELPAPRVAALLEVLEEASGKVIIWAAYTADIRRIAAEIAKEHGPWTVVTYYGETSDANRSAAVAAFQDPCSPVRFFVGQPRTGGYGLTLTAADTVVYYANSYDLEVRQQSEDRAHRIGQEKPVNYVDLVARGTVDEKIIQALREKLNLASEVLGDGWREWLV